MIAPRHFRSLVLALTAIGLAAGTPVFAQGTVDVQRMVIEEALNSHVPPALALAVAKVESNFQSRAVSPAGAKGVMQIMPKTARDVFGVAEAELWNARLNIQLGIDYLEQLYEQYGKRWDLALSHYNGGTLDGGRGSTAMPHAFTRKYVDDVLRWQRIYSDGVFRQVPTRRDEGSYGPARTPPELMRVAGRAPDPRDGRPWRNTAAAERPWRTPARIDPLEFNDWAETERRRVTLRRDLDDFSARDSQ